MVDTVPISGLTTGSSKLSDETPATDVTDSTQAPTGTTKKYYRYATNSQLYSQLGMNVFTACQAATTANLNATYSNGTSGVGATLTNAGTQVAFTTDGYAANLNDRIAVINQSSPAQNGIYSLTTVGTASTNWVLTRTTDVDTAVELIYGSLVLVSQGVTYGNTCQQLTFSGTVTVGTTALNWAAAAIGVLPYLSLNGSYSLGGIVYSTATQGAILAGTTTANQMLQSGSSAAPVWSTATWPSTTTVSQLLYSSSANVVGGLATVNDAVLTTSATGVPTWKALNTNGLILIGSGSGAPAAANITASLGVTVTNGANTIAIAGNQLGVTALTHASTPYTVLGTDQWLACTVSGGVLSIKLPNAPTTGTFYYINDVGGNAGTNNITVTTVGGSVNIQGATSYTMNSNYAAIIVAFNGTSYSIL